MIDFELYISQLIQQLKAQFQSRLVYVGLQGSYLRGEANEQSDIDIMVVIDDLSVFDLSTYREIIESLPYFDRSCGFICSKADLSAWNPLEICNLLNSTKDYYGKLSTLTPNFTDADIRNFVKFSLNNLYHEICHSFIHRPRQINAQQLCYTYKCVFYILQNLHYLRTGTFVMRKGDLINQLSGMDREVLLRSTLTKDDISHCFDDSFQLLFDWCQNTLQSI